MLTKLCLVFALQSLHLVPKSSSMLFVLPLRDLDMQRKKFLTLLDTGR